MIIRQGSESDVGATVVLALPVLEELGLESSPAVLLDTAYRRYLHRQGCLWLVVEDDGEIVATLLAQVRSGGLVDGIDGFVEAVAVRPDYRGQGLAERLLERAEEWAASLGAPSMHLMIPASSPMKIPARYGAVETWYRKELRHG